MYPAGTVTVAGSGLYTALTTPRGLLAVRLFRLLTKSVSLDPEYGRYWIYYYKTSGFGGSWMEKFKR